MCLVKIYWEIHTYVCASCNAMSRIAIVEFGTRLNFSNCDKILSYWKQLTCIPPLSNANNSLQLKRNLCFSKHPSHSKGKLINVLDSEHVMISSFCLLQFNRTFVLLNWTLIIIWSDWLIYLNWKSQTTV